MLARLYYYRGFEISAEPQPVTQPAQSCLPSAPVRYRCMVRIQQVGSVLHLDPFTIERSGNQPFEDEFEAVLYACHAAERRINLHRAISAREPHRLDVIC